MKKPDGGPAFPTETDVVDYLGMSLRQWYAGQIAQGLMANCGLKMLDEIRKQNKPEALDYFSTLCFQFADALIAEGQKE